MAILSLKQSAFVVLAIAAIIAFPCRAYSGTFYYLPGTTIESKNSGLKDHLAGIRKIGLVEPDVKINQVSAGGVTEHLVETSRECNELLCENLSGTFDSRLVPIQKENMSEEIKTELGDVSGLFSLVSTTIKAFDGRGPGAQKGEFRPVDYTVGEIGELLDNPGG